MARLSVVWFEGKGTVERKETTDQSYRAAVLQAKYRRSYAAVLVLKSVECQKDRTVWMDCRKEGSLQQEKVGFLSLRKSVTASH